MKMKYCIGFFLGVFLLICVLGIGYQISYQYLQNQNLPEQVKAEQESELTVKTEGDAVKNEGYYLMELNDFVAVYLYDKQTIYEYTNIRMGELPEDVQEEVRAGKYVETLQELYGFLENYSS